MKAFWEWLKFKFHNHMWEDEGIQHWGTKKDGETVIKWIYYIQKCKLCGKRRKWTVQ